METNQPFTEDPNDPSIIIPTRCFNFEHYMIHKWCKEFGKPTLERPTSPDLNIRLHCALLIFEEFKEYLTATGLQLVVGTRDGQLPSLVIEQDNRLATSLTEMFDATLDLKWVVNYAEVMHGVSSEQSDHGFAMLVDSNFSKKWTSEEVMKGRGEGVFCGSSGLIRIGSDWRILHAEGTHDHTRGCTPLTKCFVVMRPPDWKIIKSPSYTPMDVSKILFPPSGEEKTG